MSLTYNKRRVEKANFLYMKDMEENELMWAHPLEFIKYTEKDMVTKKGKKFIAKNFIFKCTETGQTIGIPATGLLTYQMNEYVAGDVLEIEYNGKDEEDRHQTTIIECSLADGSEIDAKAVKKVQDDMEVKGEQDEEDYI